MSPERWQQVKSLFQALLDQPPDQRPAFLDQACPADAELRREVESLLAFHENADQFIETPALAAAGDVLTDELLLPMEGRRIGAYKVLREIGRGGMGSVYVAIRADDQYQKRVAIKLVKRGMDTDEILHRFHNERQILASLDHPNIAKLLDGGTTDDGLPYFVMEYIEGQPIDAFCDARKLSTAERLELFRAICSAVHYAHQNLVVHRDLKPSNILVTSDGSAKLLDFGIAKLLNPALSSPRTLNPTRLDMRLLTPEYASPEQVRGEPITTASDVYSLGVILYELLTGRRPYRTTSRQPQELMHAVCEEEPDRPSTAVSRVEEAPGPDGVGAVTLTAEMVSRTREGEPYKLRQKLSGDLDNIILMAMRKEPQRRYASVEQFSEDLRRHLEGLPVVARKNTWTYRSAKFIGRHKAGVLAAAMIALALVGGIITTTWQWRVARTQRARAERRFNDVRRLANSFLYELHDAIKDLPGSTPARQLLVRRALEYLDKLAGESRIDSTLRRELAMAYERVGDVQGNPYLGNVGDTAGALESYRKALEIRRSLAGEGSTALTRCDLAHSYDRIGDMLDKTGNLSGAQENYRQALTLREALAHTNPADSMVRRELARSYDYLGNGLEKMGDPRNALAHFLKAQILREALWSADTSNSELRRDLAISYGAVGRALGQVGDKNGSLDSLKKSVRLFEALSDADPSNAKARRELAIGYTQLGELLADMGDRPGALATYRKSVATRQALAATDPTNAQARRDLAIGYGWFSDALAHAGEAREAVDTARKSLTIFESLIASDPTSAVARRDLALAYETVGGIYATLASSPTTPAPLRAAHWRDARSWYQRSLDIFLDMRARGILRASDVHYLEDLPRSIAQCHVALGK